MLREYSIDLDLLDERIRRVLGYASPHDRLLLPNESIERDEKS